MDYAWKKGSHLIAKISVTLFWENSLLFLILIHFSKFDPFKF